MKRLMQSVVAALLFTLSPLYAQQAASPPGSKAITNPVAVAGQNKTPDALSKREARKDRREHRKTVNHRQRRKH